MEGTERQISLPHTKHECACERERGRERFALGERKMLDYFGVSKKGNLQTQTVGLVLQRTPEECRVYII